MAKRSIEWPPRVVGGRLAMTPDVTTGGSPTVALGQIVALSLLDAGNANPFNATDELGVADPTFSPMSAGGQAVIRARVQKQFARLARERRARLVALAFERSEDVLTAVLTYDDLETGGRERLQVPING